MATKLGYIRFFNSNILFHSNNRPTQSTVDNGNVRCFQSSVLRKEGAFCDLSEKMYKCSVRGHD